MDTWLKRMPRARHRRLLALATITVGSLLASQSGLSAASDSPQGSAEIMSGPPTSMHQLVWSDEFDGTGLDSSKWTAQEGYRDPNRQYNTKRNVSVSGGTLKLYAKNDGYGTAPYTGGWLVCNYRPKYGYFEARLKMYNQGPGHWGTFWLTGTNSWPPEIDVSENMGNRISTGQGSYQNYIHHEGSSGKFSGVNFTSWHVYGVEWLPGPPLKFYIDGVLKHVAYGPSLTADMHMLLTHGVGTGTWSGRPDSTTPWPGILEVDWVRHWRYTGTNLAVGKHVTASGASSSDPPRNAVDGNDSTRWSTSGGFPQWIQVDLGSSKTISMVELAPYQDRAYQYEVNVSVDGVSYARVVDRRSNTRGGPVLTTTFRETSARYVRLVVTGVSGGSTSWTALREFRVFGK